MANTSGGSGPPLIPHNDRTLPAWMDLEGDHGVLVVLQMKTTTEGKPLPKNPFTVAKTVQQMVGRIASAHTENRGMSMALKVRSDKQATKLKELTKLIDGTDVVVTDHPTLNQIRCVVSCGQAIGMTEAQLVEELKDQHVIGVRRFTRLVEGVRKETASMVLTIRGTVKPEFVFFGFQRCEARLYIPAPMMCYNCYEYGHSKARCGNPMVCRHCSVAHELITNEEGKQVCGKPAFCKNCQGNHSPSAKTCPRFIEESEIARIRTEQQISFNEAKQIVAARTTSTTFANTTAQNLTSIDPRTRAHETELVKELQKELAEVKKALAVATDARMSKKEIAEAKKATREVQEARAALKELAETKEALAKLSAARKADEAEINKLKKVIQSMKPQQQTPAQIPAQTETSDEEEILIQPTTEQQKKKKKQKKNADKKESSSPEPKKSKNSHEHQQGGQENLATAYLKDKPETAIQKPDNRRKNNRNKNDRSRSRSRSLTRSVQSN